LSETCRAFHGDFTLLWHNHMLASKDLKRVYTNVVESVA
jgi:hypothetical protein